MTRLTRCLEVFGCFLDPLDSEWPDLADLEVDARFEVGISMENSASSARSFSRREISLSTCVEILARESSWRLDFRLLRLLLEVRFLVLRLTSVL